MAVRTRMFSLMRAPSLDIAIQYAAIDFRQRLNVGDRRALVDLVHGLADEAELEHWAIIDDEARVRRAAAGVELRAASGHVLDSRDDEIGERAGLRQERVGIRRLPFDARGGVVARKLFDALLDQRTQRRLGVAVVMADVEARASLRWDHVPRRVAGIDGQKFEIRWREMICALIERVGIQRADKRRDVRQRIVRAVGISDMALLALDDQRAGQRAAPPDLNEVAERIDVARLAAHAKVELFAALGRPVEQFHGAIDGGAFLVAGDEEGERAFWLAAIGLEIGEYGGD